MGDVDLVAAAQVDPPAAALEAVEPPDSLVIGLDVVELESDRPGVGALEVFYQFADGRGGTQPSDIVHANGPGEVGVGQAVEGGGEERRALPFASERVELGLDVASAAVGGDQAVGRRLDRGLRALSAAARRAAGAAGEFESLEERPHLC